MNPLPYGRITALALALLVSFPAHSGRAAETAVSSIVAERHLNTGKEQMALVLGGDFARLSLNSNFIDPEGKGTRLGLFRAPMNDRLRALLEEVQGFAGKLEQRDQGYAVLRAKPLIPAESPHTLRLRVAGHEVRSEERIRDGALKALEEVWGLADWQPEDSAEVTIEGGARGKVRYSGKSAGLNQDADKTRLSCGRSESGILTCKVPGFGFAYLRR